ncbi:MAG: RNA-guided pseudouridylation complex pseudouridine synthase subunit Cbf5 [Candidatus Thorarchaeota archaeon]|nr:RNA-guided pseudouridylation complex pseudouridine synthase subunit Cbf5 [Candidatus Thorarchaeota archaeon]
MPRLLPADRPRERLLRAQDSTDPAYGFAYLERLPMDYLLQNSVVVLDKPAGPTSHEVVSWVKRILNVDRAGHSGTLDPSVTGVLPIGVGRATKAMQALLTAGKEYVCLMELHDTVSEDRIRAVVEEFTGKIYQKPPLKSSVKRVLRVREIYYNDLLEIDGRDVLFRVGCEAGTYIRKLCFDIGEALGVGAHMKELRRTRVGRLVEDEHLCSLHDLKDAYEFYKQDKDETQLRRYLLPVEYALLHLPYIEVRDSAVNAVCYGADLAATGVTAVSSDIKNKDMVVIKTQKGEAVAIARASVTSEAIVKANRGIVATTDRVLMERDRYPTMWKKREAQEPEESS